MIRWSKDRPTSSKQIRQKLACGLLAVIGGASIISAASADDVGHPLEVYGFVQTDLINDSNRIDPDWLGGFRPSKISTTQDTASNDGETTISVRQSQLGIKDAIQTNNSGTISFRFEFDLFGTHGNAGRTTFRLRYLYGDWGPVLVGQTNSLFMDDAAFPNIIDYWGPPGLVFVRNPQLRVTPISNKHMHFSIAVERPVNDIDVGQVRELDANLSKSLQHTEPLPDITSQWYVTGRSGHMQLAGVLRDVAYNTRGTLNNEPHGSRIGWGINTSGHIGLSSRDKLIGQVVYGHGIASYMNDGGTDLAPSISSSPVRPHGGSISAKAVPLLGIVAYYDHYWSNQFSTSLGYSLTRVDNTNYQTSSAFHEGEYASVNLLWTPDAALLFGIEGLWGKRIDNDRNDGSDLRLQVSARYRFGLKL